MGEPEGLGTKALGEFEALGKAEGEKDTNVGVFEKRWKEWRDDSMTGGSAISSSYRDRQPLEYIVFWEFLGYDDLLYWLSNVFGIAIRSHTNFFLGCPKAAPNIKRCCSPREGS